MPFRGFIAIELILMAIKTNKAIKISQKHLLGIQDLSVNDINYILDESEAFIKVNQSKNKKIDVEVCNLEAFTDYWTALNRSKTKMKFELQQTFEISRRLKTWMNNNFNTTKKAATKKKEAIPT